MGVRHAGCAGLAVHHHNGSGLHNDIGAAVLRINAQPDPGLLVRECDPAGRVGRAALYPGPPHGRQHCQSLSHHSGSSAALRVLYPWLLEHAVPERFPVCVQGHAAAAAHRSAAVAGTPAPPRLGAACSLPGRVLADSAFQRHLCGCLRVGARPVPGDLRMASKPSAGHAIPPCLPFRQRSGNAGRAFPAASSRHRLQRFLYGAQQAGYHPRQCRKLPDRLFPPVRSCAQ